MRQLARARRGGKPEELGANGVARWKNSSRPTADRWLPPLSESKVIQWWNSLLQSAHVVTSDLDEKPEVVDTLLKLFFASDEACAGLGMTHPGACKASAGEHRDLPPLNEAPTLLGQANRILTQLNRGRTLCLQVHPDTVCVLPKLHTAQVGLTL